MLIEIDGKKIEYSLSQDNCHIINSYLITSIDIMKKFIEQLLCEAPFNARPVMSYVDEWCAHNFLYDYKIAVDSTKDVDLDLHENIFRKFAYFILGLIYRFKHRGGK